MNDDRRRRELAAFLRARREQLQPQDVGLPTGVSRRRTPGLRREEVSQLSGVGLTWYTWLEQARDIPTSRQVIAALASALRMDADDRKHLYTLAGFSAPQSPSDTGGVADAVRRMLGNLVPNPAYVIDERFDILAWNEAQAALWLDLATVPADDRNLLWLMFTDQFVRDLLVDWAGSAQRLLGQFRAAAGQGDDSRFVEVADRLRARGGEFAEWWDSYPVAEFDVEVNVLDHPEAGRINLDLLHMRLVEHPTLTVVLQTPVGPADAERLAVLLASRRAA